MPPVDPTHVAWRPETVVLSIVLFLVLALPLAVGGVHSPTLVGATGAASLALIVAAMNASAHRTRLMLTDVGLWISFLIWFGLIQCIPLPEFLGSLLSPESTVLHKDAGELVGSALAERMHPFLSAVVDASRPAETPLRVLDVGCSYGISSALLKTDCSYGALSAFYRDDASLEYDVCVRETQQWLQECGVREDVTVVGLDSSNTAVRFATDARLIDRGIACDLEVTGASLAEAASVSYIIPSREPPDTSSVSASCSGRSRIRDRSSGPR